MKVTLPFLVKMPSHCSPELLKNVLFKAGYEAGSRSSALPQAYMNSLDNQLVPIVHGQAGSRAAFELVFHVLDV